MIHNGKKIEEIPQVTLEKLFYDLLYAAFQADPKPGRLGSGERFWTAAYDVCSNTWVKFNAHNRPINNLVSPSIVWVHTKEQAIEMVRILNSKEVMK